MSEIERQAESLSATSTRLTWTWQGFLAVTSALVGAAAVLLHLIGNAVHQSYLDKWGIDPGQFPKSTDWLVIQGYYGIWSALGVALSSLMRNVEWVILAGMLMGLYLLALKGNWTPSGSWANKLFTLAKKAPEPLQKVLSVVFVGGFVSAAALPLTFALFVFAGLPAIVGKGIGDDLAQRQSRDFARGCIESTTACVRLLKDEKLVSEGYLIDSSDSHIAVLDMSLKRVRVIERGGLELQSTRYP